MSFDMYIGTPAREHCGRGPDEFDIGNYTANMGGYFRLALSEDGKSLPEDVGRSDSRDGLMGNTIEGGIPGLDGMKSADVIPMVARALTRTESATSEFLDTMNAQNGWGDWRGAWRYLSSIGAACAEYPEGTIRVSW